MKRLVLLIVGMMVTLLLVVGCGGSTESKKVSKEVTVDVEVIDGDDKPIPEDKWIKYTFQSDDTSTARRQCQESYYWHLDQGETVSEIIETSDSTGNTIFYFKTKGRVAG